MLATINSNKILKALQNVVRIKHNAEIGAIDYSDMQQLDLVLNINNLNLEDVLRNLTLSCEELILKCKWDGVMTDCGVLFEETKTYEGFCCSFNHLNENYVNDSRKRYNSIYFGPLSGLKFAVNMTVGSRGYSKTYFGDGAKLILHKPKTFPTNIARQFILNSNRECLIELTPVLKKAMSDIQSLPIDTRNCLLPHETHIEYFQKYTYVNCITQCLIKQILHFCQCVPYIFPNPFNDSVCRPTEMMCLYENYEQIFDINTANQYFVCGCHVPCTSITTYPSFTDWKIVSTKYTMDQF